MDSPPRQSSRLRAYLISKGIAKDTIDLDAEEEAFKAHITAVAAKMPKLVDALDQLTATLQAKVFASFQSLNANLFFKDKYDAFNNQLSIDVMEGKPPQMIAFTMFFCTTRYDYRKAHSRLAEKDDHGDLPSSWRAWATVMLANFLAFQHNKIENDTRDFKSWIHAQEELGNLEGSVVLAELIQVTWKKLHDRVQEFNQALEYMCLEYSKLMVGIKKEAGEKSEDEAQPVSICDVLREELKKIDPSIDIPDLVILEDEKS